MQRTTFQLCSSRELGLVIHFFVMSVAVLVLRLNHNQFYMTESLYLLLCLCFIAARPPLPTVSAYQNPLWMPAAPHPMIPPGADPVRVRFLSQSLRAETVSAALVVHMKQHKCAVCMRTTPWIWYCFILSVSPNLCSKNGKTHVSLWWKSAICWLK